MGDLLYVSSALTRLRNELPPGIGLDLAAGRGLWADAVRHLPAVDRILPTDSWDDITRLARDGGYERVLVARVTEWMPWRRYFGWTLRAQLEGKHLVDVLAATLGVRLDPADRHPLYVSDPSDPEDDPTPARELGRYAVVALHGYTHHGHNESAWRLLLPPLLDDATKRAHRLVIVGPPGEPIVAAPGLVDRRGESIRRVAALVERAAVVVSVLNGITVLADALERPVVLLALGRDPLSVVGPLRPPLAVFGAPGSKGASAVNVSAFVDRVGRALAEES